MKMSVLAFAVSLAAACYPASDPAYQARATVSPDAPLARYHSFTFGFSEEPPAGHQSSPRTLEVERRVRDLIASALRRRGYLEDDADPSFVVRFGVGVQRMGTRGFEESNPTSSDEESYVYLQEIQLDVFDAKTRTAVWRSFAISPVDLEKAVDESLLGNDVQRLLASFPARSASADSPAAPPAAPAAAPRSASPPAGAP